MAPASLLQFRVPSDALAVGHPVDSLTDVRRTDARSAQIGRPNGVTRSFQVREYSVEPSEPSLARNLFAKED
jgi:hypothetical protein